MINSANLIKDVFAWVLTLELPFNTQAVWSGLNMKFGFRTAAVALALGASVQADCPDYTTYSQVSIKSSDLYSKWR